MIANDEVEIAEDRDAGEGTEFFTLEITNATLVLKPEYQFLLLSSDMEAQVVLHWNYSKLEIAVEDDDSEIVVTV